MSQRGRGYCPGCNAEYFNRSKPPNCGMCGYELGGTFEPAAKKHKYSPPAVEISEGVFSVKTSNRDDRCFVTTDGTLWFCSFEQCKIKRSVQHNSSCLGDFSCKHIVEANSADRILPVTILIPDVSTFVCSETIKKGLHDVLDTAKFENTVIQVSDTTFAVLGPTTASNPLGFCHVRKSSNVENQLLCTGKDCRGYAAKGKQSKTKSMCIHINMLRCCLSQCTPSTSPVNSSLVSTDATATESDIEVTSYKTKRRSTLLLAEKVRVLPYVLPRLLLESIARRDACTLLGVGEGWPESIAPNDRGDCQLCGSALGDVSNHPGQSNNNPTYLITELNPFKIVNIKVRFCSARDCLAMHQASVEKLGLFNISDKVLISLDILLEFREFFKKGHPIGNVISAKLSVLRKKCREGENPNENQIIYIEDLLYNGFFCFEMITERNLDDVVCGVCGVCPEICLGDGNEKNCCTNSQIYYTKEDETPKHMMPLPDLLSMLRHRWLERTVFTRTQDSFSIALEQLPPLIAPSLTSDAVYNTEMDKRSVYLKSSSQPTGDPALLHKMISNGEIEMDKIAGYETQFIVERCTACGIPTSGKSKQYLNGMLYALYESILIGKCPCHGFGKLAGHTGGFYHLVCRHGTTVASKFLTLTESVRDAADLYLSLKYPPTVFINDTPCGFVRHLECRDPRMARKLWGENAGCFEKPEIGKRPSKDQNVPAIVPSEFSDGTTTRRNVDSTTQSHFVLGDRFHSSSEPHKSPLCQYHDLNLCCQANSIKTSTQESQNNRKNVKRLRSSCMQSFEVHIAFNYLMDYYQNEEVVINQRKILEKSLVNGQKITRDSLMRFIIS